MADTDSLFDSETIVASSAASCSSNAGGSATPRQIGVTKLNLRVDMMVAELVAWLQQSGIPSKFLHVFEGELKFGHTNTFKFFDIANHNAFCLLISLLSCSPVCLLHV